MRYLDDLDNLKREKEEFEKYTIENYFLIKEDLEKDDWESYMRDNVRFMFMGWSLAKSQAAAKENQAKKIKECRQIDGIF